MQVVRLVTPHYPSVFTGRLTGYTNARAMLLGSLPFSDVRPTVSFDSDHHFFVLTIWSRRVASQVQSGLRALPEIMVNGQSHATEAYFGPPSEAIKVEEFRRELEKFSHSVFAQSADSLPDVAQQAWAKLSEEKRTSVEAECRCAFSSSIPRSPDQRSPAVVCSSASHNLFAN